MAALARGQSSSCTNPVLDLFTTVNGVLTDVAELEYTISEEITTPGTPIQVFPVAGRATVDVATLCPTGDKLSTGRFVALWDVPLTELIGTHLICWFFKLTPTSPEQTSSEDFEVIAEVIGSANDGYCNVSDLRDEGVPTSVADDARLVEIIGRASRMVDMYTGRYFEPRTRTITLDGRNAATMFLGPPIISITSVTVDDLVLGTDEYVVYNRHLSDQLLNPDDRENPRVEMQQPREGTILYRQTAGHRVFPRGERNVVISGVFGYTDYDGSPNGSTPELICHVTKLIVMRELWRMFDEADSRDDAARRRWITKLKTRDQEIGYANPGAGFGRQGVGPFTGDPEIDNILLQFRRPILIGSSGGAGV